MKTVEIPRLDDLPGEDRERLQQVLDTYGDIPDNALLFARIPGLGQAMFALSSVCLGPGDLSPELKWLVGHMASRVSGCQFCTAHTAHNAANLAGVAPEKFSRIWEFETAEVFSEAERAALRFAAAAGTVPNQVEQSHYDDLHRYFSERQILEMASVIAFFGFMNRWNDTLATRMDADTLNFGREHLADTGWNPDRHIDTPE